MTPLERIQNLQKFSEVLSLVTQTVQEPGFPEVAIALTEVKIGSDWSPIITIKHFRKAKKLGDTSFKVSLLSMKGWQQIKLYAGSFRNTDTAIICSLSGLRDHLIDLFSEFKEDNPK